MTFNLDKKNDVLYIRFTDTSNSYGEERSEGFIVLTDMTTNKITGATII